MLRALGQSPMGSQAPSQNPVGSSSHMLVTKIKPCMYNNNDNDNNNSNANHTNDTININMCIIIIIIMIIIVIAGSVSASEIAGSEKTFLPHDVYIITYRFTTPFSKAASASGRKSSPEHKSKTEPIEHSPAIPAPS